uniref:Ig-like domain-containing protein n=1 Tax=Magallana gigas TaxID=29159 RepID=A0A8W8NZT4_MAGGI
MTQCSRKGDTISDMTEADHDKSKRVILMDGESGGKFCKTLSIWSSLLHQEDIPKAEIETASKVFVGSKTIFKPLISSCPSPIGVEWQKSIDRKNFTCINVRDSKYKGSSFSPKSPLLVITNTTFEDVLYYRLRVWNRIGENFSNELRLNVTGKPPFVSTHHKSYRKTCSVRLIGKVSVTDRYPLVHTVYWTKNGEKIDTITGGRKFSKVTIKNPTLTIHNVNHQDAGSYQLTAINAVGSNKSDIVLDLPVIRIKRRENPDGSQCFTAKITSIPEACHAQWKVKKNDDDEFSLIDVNNPEYKGTSNSLPCPVLVVTKKELLENQCFHIEVENFIGSTIKGIFDTPVRYLYFKPAKHFHHFHFVYNLMRDCKSRVEKALCIIDQTNLMSEDVVIRIGIAGNFHEDNLNLISRTWKGKLPENQHIWDVSPLLCFQNNLSLNSVFKILRQISAHHRIIIKSDAYCNEIDETINSMIIVGENKQQILETITTCLEEPLHNLLQKWLEDLKNENVLTKLEYDVIAEIEAIHKLMVFDSYKSTNDASILKEPRTQSIVPNNVKEYLFELSDVHSFGIWRNSSLKVFVRKNTDEKRVKKELMKINNKFFEKFRLEIEKRILLQKQTLMQGDQIMSGLPPDDYHKGTLGGFVREINNKRKIYALTCNHILPLLDQPAYIDGYQGLNKVGACVFTTKENSCDFAAVEIADSFTDECDVAIRRDDKKRVNARLYTESLENHGIVFKIGATTDVTKGFIISSEFYDKLHHDNIFLVKGICGPFSEEGDSGSLVFSRPKSAQQTYVNVFGMVFANNAVLVDGDDDHDVSVHDDQDRNESHSNTADNVDTISENISVCYRIHTALELFKEAQKFDVQFQDDLSEKSSSSLQSYSSDESLNNM